LTGEEIEAPRRTPEVEEMPENGDSVTPSTKKPPLGAAFNFADSPN